MKKEIPNEIISRIFHNIYDTYNIKDLIYVYNSCDYFKSMIENDIRKFLINLENNKIQKNKEIEGNDESDEENVNDKNLWFKNSFIILETIDYIEEVKEDEEEIEKYKLDIFTAKNRRLEQLKEYYEKHEIYKIVLKHYVKCQICCINICENDNGIVNHINYCINCKKRICMKCSTYCEFCRNHCDFNSYYHYYHCNNCKDECDYISDEDL